ncbi:MAG: hypothetical protein AAF581_04660 [Planctomycetota bacterium]
MSAARPLWIALAAILVVSAIQMPLAAQVCAPPTTLTCVSDCGANSITFSWVNAEPYAALQLDLVDSQGVLAHTETLAGAATATTAGSLPAERYIATLTAQCANGASALVTCSLTHSPYSGGGYADFIWAAEGIGGAVDSVTPLRDALAYQGLQAIVIDDLLSYSCFGPPDQSVVVWVCLGTFPNHHVLSAAEGALLANFVANGVSVYVEGSEVWSGPATAFSAIDGVDETLVTSGDDSLTEIELLPFDCYVNLPDLAGYNQDNAAAGDSTDRAVLGAENGGLSKVLFRNSVDDVGQLEEPYPTVVLNEQAHFGLGVGDTITSSWEFGGYAGNQYELALAYRQQLSPFFVVDLALLPGDCNGDGVVNIADPVASLLYLFDPTVTSIACAHACDWNNDDTLDIGDPIALLGSLFGSGGPPLPQHGCTFVSCSFTLDCNLVTCF